MPQLGDINTPVRKQYEKLYHSKMESMGKNECACVRIIVGTIVKKWPTDPRNVAKANLCLVSPYSFYSERFRPILEGFKDQEINGAAVARTIDLKVCWRRTYLRVMCPNKNSQIVGYVALWEKASPIELVNSLYLPSKAVGI